MNEGKKEEGERSEEVKVKERERKAGREGGKNGGRE